MQSPGASKQNENSLLLVAAYLLLKPCRIRQLKIMMWCFGSLVTWFLIFSRIRKQKWHSLASQTLGLSGVNLCSNMQVDGLVIYF